MKKIFALALVISVLGAFVAGCGEKKDDAAATPAATGTDAKTADAKAPDAK